MIFNIKKVIYSISFLLTALNCFSQLNLEEFINIKLGETFKESKNEIKAMFSEKGTIMKSDFFGAYRIQYENTPFDYYGDGNYTFQYAKDTLVSIKVEFVFLAPDTMKFRRLFSTLISDLAKDKSKKLLEQYSNINSQNIFKYVKSQCITTTNKSDKNYKPIKTKFLGQNYWTISSSVYTSKFLRLFVELIETHDSYSNLGINTSYDGGKVAVTIELMSENFKI